MLATGPGLAALHSVVEAVPGLGVLRDAQKWVALAMPGYALAGAGAVVTLRRWLSSSGPAVAARLGLGRRRKSPVGALPRRLGGRRGNDQPRARRGRGVAGRHHAAVQLVWSRTGAGPATAMAARRRPGHR